MSADVRVTRRATNAVCAVILLKLYYALARPLYQFYNMGALQLLSSAYIPYGEQALVHQIVSCKNGIITMMANCEI